MSHRPGVMSRLRSRIKQGKGGKSTLVYLEAMLRDPCVYCQELGCDSFDHIVPIAWIDELNTGFGKSHWSNLAPCHRRCNMVKGSKDILHNLLDKTYRSMLV